MKRLYCLCARLTLIFSVCTALVMLSAKGQMSVFEAMFSTPDGQPCATPCLFGVEPGITTLEEAVSMLRLHPLTSQLAWIDTTDPALIAVEGQGVVISVHGNPGELIRDVLMFFVDDAGEYPPTRLSRLYLGEAQLLFAAPTRVSIATAPLNGSYNPRLFASWYYDPARLLLTARLLDQRMSALTPLKHIQLSADRRTLGQFSPINYAARIMVTYTTEQWLGFTSSGTYIQAAVKAAGVRQLFY